MTKLGRNQPCSCGSQKKYKKCCLNKIQPNQIGSNDLAHVIQLLRDGKLPIRSEITSTDGTSATSTLSNVKLVDEHSTHQVFDDNILLSVGGDGPSKAILELPIQSDKLGRITTTGEAKVTNDSEHYSVIIDGGRKLKSKSESGLFASVTTNLQRDINTSVCHIYFGQKGIKEYVSEEGQKNRPHICLSSKGDGLYSRLASYKCSISTRSAYDRHSRTMSVDYIHIQIDDWGEQLEVNFQVDHSTKTVTINEVVFLPLE